MPNETVRANAPGLPSPKTVTDVLDAMLALYAAPGTWTQPGVAQDAAGREVAATSPEAVSWSLEGALYRVIGDPDEDGITEDEWRRRETLTSAVSEACGVYLAEFNDTVRRQDVVVAVLRSGLDRALTWERDRAAA